ncbi:RHS repeat-associated core domain-containing protein [Gracilibacillus sp. D59]|uniref:RHS repeat-associated core domain-containing protein n=1 Tax=Gracilibacillus sp. D59 TaxID=3457434 RepID=UPI003FCD095B
MFGYHGRSIPGHDPSMKTTGGMMYHQYDGMSTVSELTDRHGDVIERYRYDAFGGINAGITAPYNVSSYTGHQFDQDAGLIDMQARFYDASVGRFLQEDTYQGTIDQPLSQNRYAYVMNNPMKYWDPTGRTAEPIQHYGEIPQEVLDRQSFIEERVAGVHRVAGWEYRYQDYAIDTRPENYKERTTNKAKIITWDEVKEETWYYRAEHIWDRWWFGGIGGDYLEQSGTFEDHEYHRTSRSPNETVITAEEMMETNFEKILAESGTLLGVRSAVFNSITTSHVSQQYVNEIGNTGPMHTRDILEGTTYLSSGYGNWNKIGQYTQKSFNSFGNIGKSVYDGLVERNRNKSNSVYDFTNYITSGVSGGFYTGLNDRAKKMMDSPYDFMNWASMGLVETVDQAIFPEKPLSEEHWLSSLNVVTIGMGTGLTSSLMKSSTSTLPKNMSIKVGNKDTFRYTKPTKNLRVDLQFFGKGKVNPTFSQKDIRYTQDSIKKSFKDGGTVDDLATGLKNGSVNKNDIPAIRVFQHTDGNMYSLDNRRLYAFKQAGIDPPQVWAPNDLVQKQIGWKMTTKIMARV